MNARELIESFEKMVQHQIAQKRKGRLVASYYNLGPKPIEWRSFWVNTFIELCEPLYRVVSLPNHEYSSSSQCHQFISKDDQTLTLKSFEEFCSQTEMNHILDGGLSTFAIFDCIVSLAGLVRMIAGFQRVTASFQYQRITYDLQIMTHILIRDGHLRGADVDNILEAIQQVRFPIERYSCRK